MTDDHLHRRRGLFGGLRASFLTGLVVVLPIGLTIYLIWTVIGWIDAWVLPLVPYAWKPDTLIHDYFGPDTTVSIRGVGVIVFLVFTILVGWIAKGMIGRALLRPAERIVERMPVVRSVYTGLKQIAETVFSQTGSSFERACLVRFPHPDSWAVGFVAAHAKGEIAARLPAEGNVLTVFVATGFVPPTGFLLFVAEKDVIMLDMSLEEAAKLVISAGLVFPAPKPPALPPDPAPAA